jgi:hypothetical protein
MKLLRTSFEANYDGTGRQQFELIAKQSEENKTYAMYKRTRLNGTLHGYEVFEVKTRLKGQPLPGGMVEEQDRECYPGANAFGRYAWDFKCRLHAEEAFNNLLRTGKPFKPVQNVSSMITKFPSEPVNIMTQLPDNDFTIDELMEELDDSKQNIYLKVKQLIHENKVKVVGERKVQGQRGRAKKVYSLV